MLNQADCYLLAPQLRIAVRQLFVNATWMLVWVATFFLLMVFVRNRYCNVEVSSSADKAIVCDATQPRYFEVAVRGRCVPYVRVCLASSLPWDLMLALFVWRLACEYVFGNL